MGWKSRVSIRTLPYAKHSCWEAAVSHRELSSTLCGDLESGREVHEGEDVCIHIADSLHCAA